MTDLISWAITLLVPGAGVLGFWGIVLKVAARFGLGWVTSVTSGPLGSIMAKLGEGLVDVGVWIVKGVFGWLGEQLVDVFRIVSKDLRLAAVIWLAAWAGHAYGIGNVQVAPQQSPAKSAPAKPISKPAPAPQTGFFDWLDEALRF